jgi:hypothetical protein
LNSESQRLSIGRVTTRITATGNLSVSERDTLFALYDQIFESPSKNVFLADLDDKDEVILLVESGCLVGFSAMKFYQVSHCGERLNVLYSGDTVVDRRAWGTTALPRAWIRRVLEWRERTPDIPLDWLLLAGSYRTYHFLTVFFREFYPRRAAASPPEVRERASALANQRFGQSYDRERGVVSIPGAPRLRPGVADLEPGKLAVPDIAYYVSRNPGYADGDELVCLCRVAVDNLTAAGMRMLR